MKYLDLHCDALTKSEGVRQITREYLEKGGCALQCFAAFIAEREGRFERALSLCDAFDAMCEKEGYNPVRRASDLKEGAINALLTVEEGGAIEGELEKLETLYLRGVRMMTLTWNYPNEIGFPNLTLPEEGIPDFSRRETAHGLTTFGRECVERMGKLGMIVDTSHGSDALFGEVAAWSEKSGIPFVASHSGAAAVYEHTRNLTDAQIRTLAGCGGVVGLDFCADFLSDDKSAEGQKEAILAHARHILNTGGEDTLALGSDFDGIPENAYMKNASYLPRLLGEFEKAFGTRITEKIAYINAERVIKTILK